MPGPLTMRRIVYLARHGETDWNRESRWQGHADIALNDQGRAQAAALAERLRPLGVVRAITSDLSRARETAAIVASRLGLPLDVDPALRERCFGVFEGLTADECARLHAEDWRRYQADHGQLPAGAERREAVVARMTAGVLRAARLDEGDGVGAILAVSHGGAIRSLLSATTGRRFPPIGNGALVRVVVSPAGLADVEAL